MKQIIYFFTVKTAILLLLLLSFSTRALAQEVLWKKNFGGINLDQYRSVTAVSDSVIAVGYSVYSSFGTGYWAGITGKGGTDAIIVKYDHNENVVWKKNFGGSANDEYNSVTAVSDGVVVVGQSTIVGDGDWVGVTSGDDAIIVKYDNNGNVLWKKNFGGNHIDEYNDVTAVSDGVVAVGWSYPLSFGTGDWAGVTGNGSYEAIIVKYDNNGNVVWKKHFGGSGYDYYESVTAVSDGVVAVGSSDAGSFGNGDWAGVTGKGNVDAIIVKYDNDGNIVWKNNFGGNDYDVYYSVTTVSDGVVVAGMSFDASFGTGDWAGVTGKGGNTDAIIVKYDNNGNIIWKENFGGNDNDCYISVTSVLDDVVAVGYSRNESFGNSDWTGIAGKGDGDDAIIVKYDNNGIIVWKKNFGGSGNDYFNSVTAVFDGVVAAGWSFPLSFGNGDWTDFVGEGFLDGIIVKYTHTIFDDNITVDTIPNHIICVGNTFPAITFSGIGATIFNWVRTNTAVGIPTTSGTNILPSFTATNSGTTPLSTTVTVNPRNSDGIYGIPKSFVITVYPNPIILVQDSSVCENHEGILIATGAETYIWSNGSTGDTLHVFPSSSTTYTVTGTDIWGCTGTGEGRITVYPNPIILVQDSSVCEGREGILVATGAETYIWSNGATGDTLHIIANSTTTYTVTGTNIWGCTGTEEGTITVNPSPIIFVQDSSICQGKDGILIATGAETYIWSNGATGDTLHVLPSSSTAYTVTGTNIWGCTGTGEGTITVNPNPIVTIYAEDVCNRNDIGTFIASGAETYLWNNGSTGETISAIIKAITTYTVTGTDINGCTGTATGTIKIRSINAAIYADTHTITTDVPSVNFFDHSTGGNPVYWLWSFGDGNISTEQNPSNQYTETGIYIVQLIVTDDRGCIDTAFYEIKVIIPFHFYIPNSFTPNSNGTNEVFAPKGEGVLEEGYEMLIYNRWGNLLFRTTEPYGSWDGRDKNGNLLPTGVYVYTIKLKTSERKTKTYKGEITLLR